MRLLEDVAARAFFFELCAWSAVRGLVFGLTLLLGSDLPPAGAGRLSCEVFWVCVCVVCVDVSILMRWCLKSISRLRRVWLETCHVGRAFVQAPPVVP